ncbi:hypothetical protein DS891_14625 [Pseudoalteromonas sp. JC28]|uniref:hypothetical protein n=1 Tax=Pseudoalteromonas TaxID=53246 RepID=UPI00029AAB45|nr:MULTISPECIES: hypothetical protein [Pseudoalteromonas]MCF2828718.1 hypothetical protein [Pseudoalteromonas sp. OF5H-5]MCF2830791.1 hypothetical protein [Pseudoalteromonas sp. DL2-H6]MCF2925110.1 hypothetical protein [Pseudoalteromonas sp. DL2-H1]MCG7554265.1 hypothetical protein [Pseudoalteromonas sp. Of11M-6]NSY34776.1 hypothetical protein [Pseudoalteromonas sp. JC28]
MKELNLNQVQEVNGAAWTSDHLIAGGLDGGLTGAGAAAIYVGLASNPIGWVTAGIIGVGAAGGALYYALAK